MNEIWHAIAQAIEKDPGWILAILVFLGLVLGGIGERVSHVLSGRAKLNGAKAELKSVKAENSRLHELALRNTEQRQLVTGIQNEDVAGLAQQAQDAMQDRAEGLHLLLQIQATDNIYPQLPQTLRDDIDAYVARLRVRRTETAPAPAKGKGKKP